MYYAYSPDTDYENDRTAGKSGVAHSDDALTLDQLHHEAYGKGSGGQPGARRKKRQAFGNIGNQSRLVSEVQARKRLGASHDPKRAMNSSMTTATPLSGGTVASTDASTIKMEWDDLTTDEAAAVHAHRRRAEASRADSSPRTPCVVESPADTTMDAAGNTAGTEDTVPPGALTIQRVNLRRHARDIDAEMEEQHRRQHGHVILEGTVTRLVLWRDPARTAFYFSVGVLLLAAARAPGLVAEHVPVNPVVIAAYASMAYLCRAYVLAMAFPRRKHNLSIDAEEAADFARWCASCCNAVTNAHDDLLSGRSNKDVLRAFIALYGVASLGGLLNSTWLVACVLWCGAFAVPPAMEAHRELISRAVGTVKKEIGGRWTTLTSNQRWGSGVVVTAAVFVSSAFWTRVILGFIALVAMRLYRETHAKQLAGLERVMKDASRRLSRAGSEFHAMVSTPGLFYRRRMESSSRNLMSHTRIQTSGLKWN